MTAMPIPARLIQTYHSEYAFPPVFADCRRVARRLHPRWEHRFFSDHAGREFIRRRRPDLLELYDFYPRPVQRADLFRVVAVHELGGFYLDLDVHLFHPLDELRAARLVIAEEWRMSAEIYRARNHAPHGDVRDLFQIANYGFGAVRGHWFLGEVIEEMIRRAEFVNPSTCWNDDVLLSTGPDVLNAVYRRQRAELAAGTILLRGRNDPPEPRAQFRDGEPWHFQFGRYGNHLMRSAWRTRDGHGA